MKRNIPETCFAPLLSALVAALIWHALAMPVAISGDNYGGILVRLIYTLASFFVALVFLALLVLRQQRWKFYLLSAIFFAAGPVLANVYLGYKGTVNLKALQQAAGETRQLCEEQGGVRVFRTVQEVEGLLLQNPVSLYGSTLRWHRSVVGGLLSPSEMLSRPDVRYRFIEAIDEAQNELVAYTVARPVSDHSEQAAAEVSNALARAVEIETRPYISDDIRSRYALVHEDIVTESMQQQWIVGGRSLITDIATGEVLATLTGFYLASNPHYSPEHPWRPSREVPTLCPGEIDLMDFVLSVLVPPD